MKHLVKTIGLAVALLVYAAILETKSSIGAYHSVLDHVSGYLLAALSAICAILAFTFATIAGGLKDDERPHVAKRASWARAVSCAFLVIPILFLGSSLKKDAVDQAWAAYIASPAYGIDQHLAGDMMADRDERQSAQERLVKPAASLTILDAQFWVSFFLQSVLATGAGLKIPAPITEEERRHWRAVAAGKKAAATRKRNKAKKPAPKTGAKTDKVVPLFS